MGRAQRRSLIGPSTIDHTIALVESIDKVLSKCRPRRRKIHSRSRALDDSRMASRIRPESRRQRPGVPASPIVKWVGGKTKLLSELLARMPARYGRYYEPFVGGGALFFRVVPERAVLADTNQDLVGLYTAIANDVAAVIRRLEAHRDAHDERHYYDVRARWNDHEIAWSVAERAA